MTNTVKDTNPKDAIAGNKIALALLSPIAKAHWALAQFAGMLKYGSWNWRVSGVRASVYLHAMQRHIDAYISGEETDPVDGTHHLGNVMACAAIMLDALAAGKLTDDRPPSVSLRGVYAAVEKQMSVLREQYKDKKPKHCTILDTEAETADEARPAFKTWSEIKRKPKTFRKGDIVQHRLGDVGVFQQMETLRDSCTVDWEQGNGHRICVRMQTLTSNLTLLRRPIRVGDEILVSGAPRQVVDVEADHFTLDGGGLVFDTHLDVRHADGTPIEPVSPNAPACGAV